MRTRCVVALVAGVLLSTLFAVPALWAEEPTDKEQIRQLLQREQEGWLKGDRELVVSCFAPDAAMYDALGGRYHLATVELAGLEAIRNDYASQVDEFAAAAKAHPDWKHHFEVLHVDAKDGRGLALTQHFFVVPDPKAREAIYDGHQTLWLLRKDQGVWRIYACVTAVSGEQVVLKQGPE
jgi:uncharacterized protein (TIGR02246 family)